MIEFPLRTRIDLDTGWEFTRGRVGRRWLRGRGDAETVDLPHCWNRDDTYQYDRRSYSGHGAYRRRIEIPADDAAATWHLVSGGFYGVGDLWLDGRRLTRFDAQYLGLDVALPPAAAGRVHDLAIRLDNRYHRNVLPGRKDPDFLLYGGLAGTVRLERRPSPRIDDRSVEVRCRRGPDGSEAVELRCSVVGPLAGAAGAAVHWVVTTDTGIPAAAADAAVEAGRATATVTIPEPRCWSPDHPHLYRAEGRLGSSGETVDAVRVRFGIPRVELRPGEGLFLGGERVELRGANRHESIPGLGSALTPELHRTDARLLKRYGANLVRLSHYPQHPAFLDACDELGIMVYAEIATWKSVRSSRPWRRAARRQMRGLVRRDRHHPSLLLWGMGNESRSRKAYHELRAVIRELDPDRPSTYAENHLYRARRQRTVGIPDVWGVNYELEVLDEARAASRLGLVVVSECCNHPTATRGDQLEELAQVAVLEREWEVMAGRPFLIGHAVWSLTDYATEHRRRVRRETGLFDAWRRPKMAAELFRARFAGEPFISLFCVGARLGAPASRFRTELADPYGGGAPLRLHAFSNCAGLRFVQAGATLASIDRTPHAVMPVDLARGGITVEGIANGSTVVGRIRRWGPATAIELSRDRPTASNGDIVAVDIRIVDDAGATVPTWNGHVVAEAAGGAELRAYTAAGEVLVSRGEGRLYVRSTPDAEAPSVKAATGGLRTGRLVLGAVEEPAD